MKVWTTAYRPFIMGGSCNYILGMEYNVGEKHSIGRGFFAYEITAPNGKIFIAESTTGAFVGPSLDVVRADVKSGTPSIMRKQISEAKKQKKKIEVRTADHFWKLLGCNKAALRQKGVKG